MNIINFWLGKNLPKQYSYSSSTSVLSRFIKQPIKRHLSRFYSQYLQKTGTKIIGITGTAGKTTTKDMLKSILSQKYETKASFANIDPVYNIPTTVLNSKLTTKRIVLEMGVEFPGDMDFYNWLISPDCIIVTSVYWAHTEFFKDINGVYEEKSKLVATLSPSGVAILNFDDPLVRKMSELTKAKVLFYSLKNTHCDIFATNIKVREDFSTEFTLNYKKKKIKVVLPVVGEHFVSLALAASLCGLYFDINLVQVKRGLESFSPPEHRLVPHVTKNRGIILDDTYNANPLATKASLDVVTKVSGDRKKIFVFGEMKELGEYEKEGHQEVGLYLAKKKFDYLVCLGNLPKLTAQTAIKNGLNRKNVFIVKDKIEALAVLKNIMSKNTITLVKGSRSMKMEEIVKKII